MRRPNSGVFLFTSHSKQLIFIKIVFVTDPAVILLLFQLIELGVSPEVISISSSNAGSFRFIGRKYFSESVLTSGGGIRMEDGGVLHAGIDGCVGLEEIQR